MTASDSNNADPDPEPDPQENVVADALSRLHRPYLRLYQSYRSCTASERASGQPSTSFADVAEGLEAPQVEGGHSQCGRFPYPSAIASSFDPVMARACLFYQCSKVHFTGMYSSSQLPSRYHTADSPAHTRVPDWITSTLMRPYLALQTQPLKLPLQA
jgi:hypothetical protein